MSCNLFAASKRRGIQPILDKPIDTLSVWTDFRVPSDYDDSKCELPIYGGNASKGGKESRRLLLFYL